MNVNPLKKEIHDEISARFQNNILIFFAKAFPVSEKSNTHLIQINSDFVKKY